MKLPDKIKLLSVSAFGQESGELSQTGHFEFNYTKDNLVSITIPPR